MRTAPTSRKLLRGAHGEQRRMWSERGPFRTCEAGHGALPRGAVEADVRRGIVAALDRKSNAGVGRSCGKTFRQSAF